jgi:protein-S-isoprenylcysteine O-methyltransferase Ste14
MAIFIAAPVRIATFKQLGENFTFRLARPKEFVITGLYAYAQHPSYLTDWMVLVADITLLQSLDGVLGCFLPNWIVKWGMGIGGIVIWPLLLAIFGLLGLYAIWIRVQDEYHQRTQQFVTGVM